MEKFFDLALRPVIDGTDELYYRCNGSEMLFDTFFNMVPVNKLKKYSSADRILFEFDAENIDFRVFANNGNDDLFLTDKTEIALKDIPEDVIYIYPVIGMKENSVIRKASVYLDGCSGDVNIALIICTYKREEYVISNTDYLAKEISDRGLPVEIIVVDNAKTLYEKDLPGDVILIPNDNTGGSGGFGRGMKAASEMKKFSHFILMDDDVKTDAVSLQKLTGFLRFTKDISVSGSMLYMNDPVRQFESGGYFSSDGLQTGYGYYLDMTEKNALAANESEKKINYGGWWFMCIPMKYADAGNYPMPFFIKYDDVEYAVRCGLEIITLNGVSVWHEPFECKYNSSSEYYNMRNYLHLRSITDKNFSIHQARKIAFRQIFEKLCRQQYKMAEAAKRGYKDFRRGIDYLNEINAAENHRQICELNYEMLTEDELFEKYGVKYSEEKYQHYQSIIYKRYMRLVLFGLLIPKCFCKKDYAVVDNFFDRKEMYLGVKKALHFNRISKRGYVTFKR